MKSSRAATTMSLALSVLSAGCGTGSDDGETPGLFVVRTTEAHTFGDPQTECVQCHPQHVEEWQSSAHAYAAVDPVFHAMVELGQAETAGKLDQFCMQCHSPPAVLSGRARVYEDKTTGRFTQNTTDLSVVERQGVSCDVCHSISQVLEPVNARGVFTLDGIRRATLRDPVETPAHRSAYSALHGQSELCGMCHAVTNPKGAKIEETFGEWAASSFAEPDGQTCQDCHMPKYVGPAAKDGPTREVHRHDFVGVDVSLLPPDAFPGYELMRTKTAALLKSAAKLETWVDHRNRTLKISIENLAGHALPSGATAERQLWVRLVLFDALGNLVFETGTLDANQDIVDPYPGHSLHPGADPQLIFYRQDLFDDPARRQPPENGPPRLVTFPWEANHQINHLIAAGATDRRTIDLRALPAGTYHGTLKLLFRSFPPYFLRMLENRAGLDSAVKTRVPTVTLHEEALSFTFEP